MHICICTHIYCVCIVCIIYSMHVFWDDTFPINVSGKVSYDRHNVSQIIPHCMRKVVL